MSTDWRIEPLGLGHDRKEFSCGEPELDKYLANYARQNQDFGVARTFVVVSDTEPTRILGYYSLSAGSIEKKHLPPLAVRRFPNFPVPIARLARLAVDSGQQRKGIGEDLLLDALGRCVRVADDLGIAAVIIDAKHEDAKNFYRRYEFTELPNQPLTLWLLLPALRELPKPKA